MVQYLSGVQRKWLLFLPRTNFLSAPRKQTPPPAFASPQVHILHSSTIVLLYYCIIYFAFVLLDSCSLAQLKFCSLAQFSICAFAFLYYCTFVLLHNLFCLCAFELGHNWTFATLHSCPFVRLYSCTIAFAFVLLHSCTFADISYLGHQRLEQPVLITLSPSYHHSEDWDLENDDDQRFRKMQLPRQKLFLCFDHIIIMVNSVLRALTLAWKRPLCLYISILVFAFILTLLFVFSFAFWNANKACSVLSGLPVAWSSPTALWSVASAPWPPLGQVRVM